MYIYIYIYTYRYLGITQCLILKICFWPLPLFFPSGSTIGRQNSCSFQTHTTGGARDDGHLRETSRNNPSVKYRTYIMIYTDILYNIYIYLYIFAQVIWKTSSMCQARPSPWRSARSPASASTATSRRAPQWAPWGPGRLATSCACRNWRWTRWSLRKGEERWGKLESSSSCLTVLVVSNLEFQGFLTFLTWNFMKHVVFQHLKGCFSTFPSCPLPAPASSPSASALRIGTAQHAVDATCGNRSLVVAILDVLIFHQIYFIIFHPSL